MKSPDRDAADELERMAAAIADGNEPFVEYAELNLDLKRWYRSIARSALAHNASELATLRRRVAELETAAGNAAGRWRDALETDVEVMRTLDTMEDQMCFVKLERLLKQSAPLPPGRNEG